MSSRVISRGEFEDHLNVLNNIVVDAVALHFERQSLEFNRIEFIQAANNEIDGLIRSALFDGAQVFPVEIPTKV